MRSKTNGAYAVGYLYLQHSWLHEGTVYTLFHEKMSTFFWNKISLPERRNKRKSVLELTKIYYFKI